MTPRCFLQYQREDWETGMIRKLGGSSRLSSSLMLNDALSNLHLYGLWSTSQR